MKIKNFLLVAAASFLSLPFASAQKGLFEARFDVGYGFGSNPQSQQNVSGSTVSDVPYSMGMGINMDLSGSYFFSDHIGAGLDLNYLIGTQTTVTEEVNSEQFTSKLSGNMFAFTPFLVLSAHNAGINPYGRFGIAYGIPTATVSTTAAGQNAPSGTNISVASGNLAIGWYGAFGVEFPLSDGLFLNVELFDRSLQWEPAKAENTQSFDGAPKSPTVTYSQKVDNPTNENQVASYSTIYSPFSSVGIKVGINLKFGAM